MCVLSLSLNRGSKEWERTKESDNGVARATPFTLPAVGPDLGAVDEIPPSKIKVMWGLVLTLSTCFSPRRGTFFSLDLLLGGTREYFYRRLVNYKYCIP